MEFDRATRFERYDGIGDAEHYLQEAVYNSGWDKMAVVDGKILPDDMDRRLDAIAVASQAWDTRQGRERYAVTEATDIDVPGSLAWNETFAAANELGMVESSK